MFAFVFDISGFSSCVTTLILHCAFDLSQHLSFTYCPNDDSFSCFDHCLWNALNAELLGEFREFHCVHRFGADHGGVDHCHLMCEQHGSRAVWSGRGYKDLQVKGLCQRLQKLKGGGTQPNSPF